MNKHDVASSTWGRSRAWTFQRLAQLRFHVPAALFLATVFAAGNLCGQPQPGTVFGKVTDPSNAAVSAVEVILRDGNDIIRTATSLRGEYRFDGIPPGTYTLQLSVPSFRPVEARVRVRAGRRVEQNVRLELQALQEQLDVNASEGVSIDASANRDAISVERRMLDDLPVADLDYIAALSRFLDTLGVGGEATLIVDGVEMRSAQVTPSAIEEIRINENPYAAEYPRWSRRRIEIITKSSADEYHGTVNYLFRDASLNGRPPFSPVRPPERRNIWEGSLFGPIGRSRNSSFLLSALREHDDMQAIVFAQTPGGLRTEAVSTPDRNTYVTLRLSHQFSDNQTAFLQFNFQDNYQNNLGVGGLVLPEAGSRYRFREDEVVFNHRGVIGTSILSQFRIMFGRYWAPLNANSQEPRITVTDAFVGGGGQTDTLRTEFHTAITWMLTQTKGDHTLKYGVNVPDWSRRGLRDDTLQQGAFVFGSLADFQAQNPFLATVQRGSGRAVFIEKNLGFFLQDEWRIRDNFSITAGLRYDWQGVFQDYNNFGPRLALAYAPGSSRRFVLRAGSGFFFDRSGPYPVWDILRYNGMNLQRFVLNDPPFPSTFPDAALQGLPIGEVRLETGAQLPTMIQFNGGFDQQLTKSTTLAVNYIGLRGMHQFRSRDLNAPLPPFFDTRPVAERNVIRQIESSGRIEGNALEVTLRGALGPKVSGIAQYTFGRTMADFDGYSGYRGTFARESQYAFGQTLANAGAAVWFPANSFDPRGEWGRTDMDRRHQFNLLATGKFHRWLGLGVSASILSGVPFNITTGVDDNRDGLVFDRPEGVARNTAKGPGLVGVDARWFREVNFRGPSGQKMVVSVDAFNVLNRTNYLNFVGALSSPFFGQPVGALPPRRLQIGLRYQF